MSVCEKSREDHRPAYNIPDTKSAPADCSVATEDDWDVMCVLPVVKRGQSALICAEHTKSIEIGNSVLFHWLSDLSSLPASLPALTVIAYPQLLILTRAGTPSATMTAQAKRQFIRSKSSLRLCVLDGLPQQICVRELRKGCDVLIAAPNVVKHFLLFKQISLQFVRFVFVQDLAGLIEHGGDKVLRRLFQCFDMPECALRQTIMCTETLSSSCLRFARDLLPSDCAVLRQHNPSAGDGVVTYQFERVEPQNKNSMLLTHLRACDKQTLVFVNSRHRAQSLHDFLNEQGVCAATLHGDLTQMERMTALDSFETRHVRVLTATDVFSQGLMIRDVEHVLMYDVPSDMSEFVFRADRVKRAGGLVTCFCTADCDELLPEMAQMLMEAGQCVPQWLQKMLFRRS